MLNLHFYILIFILNNGNPVVIENFNKNQECHDFALELMLYDDFSDGNFLCIKKKK